VTDRYLQVYHLRTLLLRTIPKLKTLSHNLLNQSWRIFRFGAHSSAVNQIQIWFAHREDLNFLAGYSAILSERINDRVQAIVVIWYFHCHSSFENKLLRFSARFHDLTRCYRPITCHVAWKGPDNSAASRFEVWKPQVVNRKNYVFTRAKPGGATSSLETNSEENLEKE